MVSVGQRTNTLLTSPSPSAICEIPYITYDFPVPVAKSILANNFSLICTESRKLSKDKYLSLKHAFLK